MTKRKEMAVSSSTRRREQIGFLGGFRVVLTLTAELVTLAGVAGFLLAVLMNIAMFNRWGLNFLQLATPSDVIMSGLQITFDLIMPVLGLAAGWGVGRGITTYFGKNWRCVATSLALAILLFAVIGWIDIGLYYLVDSVGFIAIGLSLSATVDIVSILGRRFLFLFVAPATIASFFLYTLFDSTLRRFGWNGMLTTGRAVIENDVMPNCLGGQVMWLGDRSVVVDCGSGDFRVLHGMENLGIELFEPGERRSLDNSRGTSTATNPTELDELNGI